MGLRDAPPPSAGGQLFTELPVTPLLLWQLRLPASQPGQPRPTRSRALLVGQGPEGCGTSSHRCGRVGTHRRRSMGPRGSGELGQHAPLSDFPVFKNLSRLVL